MARWKTPDDAIREATACSPMRCRAIDLAAMTARGGGNGLAETVAEHSFVLAILGQFDETEQTLLVYYAHQFSYADIARGIRMRKASAILRHHQARREFTRRMILRGLLEQEPAQTPTALQACG